MRSPGGQPPPGGSPPQTKVCITGTARAPLLPTTDRLAQLGRELNAEVASFAAMLEAGEGTVRLDGDRLVVGRDTGDDLPESVKRLRGLVLGVFPQVELIEMVIALDDACGFSKHLLHSAGAKARSPAALPSPSAPAAPPGRPSPSPPPAAPPASAAESASAHLPGVVVLAVDPPHAAAGLTARST